MNLAIGTPTPTAQHDRRAYCGTLADLITSLKEAHGFGKFLHSMKTLTHPPLLVAHEVGYPPVHHTAPCTSFNC